MADGFVARRKYSLNFDEVEDLEGLRVKVRSTTVGVMQDVLDTARDEGQGVDEMLEHFVGCLIEWNLTDDDGEPVPHDPAAIKAKVDREYLIEILRAWQRAVVGVQAPLRRRSPSGGLSPVVSIPMETQSESQAS